MTTRQQNQRLSEIAAKPTFRTIDGVSIRFVESEPRNSDALLFSPWPESILAYEATWSRLAETTHLVAIDLPGFGRSERKDALMSPRAMGDFKVLPRIQTPVQIIAGRRDTVVPPVNAEYLHERLPHSELHLLDSGHFVWEDAADEYAALVNAWWADGYKTCVKR